MQPTIDQLAELQSIDRRVMLLRSVLEAVQAAGAHATSCIVEDSITCKIHLYGDPDVETRATHEQVLAVRDHLGLTEWRTAPVVLDRERGGIYFEARGPGRLGYEIEVGIFVKDPR